MLLADSYSSGGNDSLAIRQLKRVLEIIPRLSERNLERRIATYLLLSEQYLSAGNSDSALYYINLATDLDQNKSFGYETQYQEGVIHYSTGNSLTAERSLQVASAKLREAGANGNKLAKCNILLGRIELDRGNNNEALLLFHSALSELSDTYNDPDPYSTPEANSLYLDVDVLAALQFKCRALLAMSRDDDSITNLQAAWQTIRVALEYLNSLRTGYYSAGDRAVIVENSYSIFEAALDCCAHMYGTSGDSTWIDTAFVVMEQSKALNLLDELTHKQAVSFAGIPSEMIQEESGLRAQLFELESYRKDLLKLRAPADSNVVRLEEEIRSLRQKHNLLVADFERKYPKYFEIKFNNKPISIDQIQAILNKDETLLEYFISDTSGYLLLISKNAKDLHKLTDASSLDSLAEVYHNSMTAYAATKRKAEVTRYLQATSALHKKLIGNLARLLTPTVIIIPDGAVGKISFCGLVDGEFNAPSDLRSLPYLLHSHVFSYSYSADILFRLRSGNGDPGTKNIVFVPSTAKSHSEGALVYPKEEADKFQSIAGGHLISGNSCTPQEVRQQLDGADDLNVVHFATHGFANPIDAEESYLQLDGAAGADKLRSRDLYSMQFGCSLVYLSACETGSGKIRKGEGVMSLARAFFYAGARSLVTTLWAVDDKTSLEITGRFYQNARNRMPVDQALAKAQRDYLNGLPSDLRVYAHPVYWSANVHSGSSTSIQLAPRISKWMIGVIALAAMLATLFLARRKKFKRGGNTS